MVEKRKYRDFYENHVLYGAKHCDLEMSQWGVGSDPFREERGQALTEEVARQVLGQGICHHILSLDEEWKCLLLCLNI